MQTSSHSPKPFTPLPTTTPTPNIFCDYWMDKVTGNEFKVLMFLTRRTLGWHKDSDKVSLSQFTDGIMRRDGTQACVGTGLSRSTICEALSKLEQLGLIQKTKSSKSGGSGRNPNTFSVDWMGKGNITEQEEPTHGENRIVQNPDLQHPESGPSTSGQPDLQRPESGPTKENSYKRQLPKEESGSLSRLEDGEPSRLMPNEGSSVFLDTFGGRPSKKIREAMEEYDTPELRQEVLALYNESKTNFPARLKRLLEVWGWKNSGKGSGGGGTGFEGNNDPPRKSHSQRVTDMLDKADARLMEKFGRKP